MNAKVAHRYLICAFDSLSQFLKAAWLLHDTYIENPGRIRWAGYDRACDLDPMLKRLSKSQEFAKTLYSNIGFFVDTFHCNKHTEKFCRPDSPDVRYHLMAERFETIRGTNSEICDKLFDGETDSVQWSITCPWYELSFFRSL